MTIPGRYQVGAIPPARMVQGDSMRISLNKCGIRTDISPREMQDGDSPNCDTVRFINGGVAADFGFSLLGTRYTGVADKNILHIAEFQRKSLATVLVRMRPTGWDRWNGATWLTLGGATTNIAGDLLYSTVTQDTLVVANKVQKLQKWDGIDGDNVQDLSADAPIAYYVAPFGQRLVAARIDPGGGVDPYRVQWSEDGNIFGWTNANNGAGSVILSPEGKTGSPQFITGLSALETALVVYRDRSIMIGTRTGIGAAPFRWATVVFGLGTNAPYSIANGGATIGDFFLGSDLNVYHFDGQSKPYPIGAPIVNLLRTQINNVGQCVGVVDRRFNQYHLFVPTGSSTTPTIDWVFDINAYLYGQESYFARKLSWRKRTIGAGYNFIGFGSTAGVSDPIVNSVNTIVNQTPGRVNDYANNFTPAKLLLGDNNGGVSYLDETVFVPGSYETKEYGDLELETRLDRVFISYLSTVGGQIGLSYSTDGGLSYGNEVIYTLAATNYVGRQGQTFAVVLQTWQFKIRIISGDITVTEIDARRAAAGRATT